MLVPNRIRDVVAAMAAYLVGLVLFLFSTWLSRRRAA